MRLLELEPRFLSITGAKTHKEVDSIEEADGVIFLCPKCFLENKNSNIGVHSVICWEPYVPQTRSPVLGRWYMIGTCLDDLTLRGPLSSILLPTEGGYLAHFFIENGKIRFA